jgi:hypothetical protein
MRVRNGQAGNSAERPCAACHAGVQINCIPRHSCKKCVNERYSGVKGTLAAVAATFRCFVCIRGSVSRKLVRKLIVLDTTRQLRVCLQICYLGDMIANRDGVDEETSDNTRIELSAK